MEDAQSPAGSYCSIRVVQARQTDAQPLIVALDAVPDLVALATAYPGCYPGLFTTRGDAGWDILFAWPQEIERIDSVAALAAHPAMRLKPGASSARSLPFTGGWLAFFPYELGAALEPTVPGRDRAGPLAWLARIPAAVLVDRSRNSAWMVAESDGFLSLLGGNLEAAPPTPGLAAPQAIREEAAEVYLAGVKRIQDYIRAGDVFQVNYARAWRARYAEAVNPGALFAGLLGRNPAPFSALLNLDGRVGGQAVVSSSPERLFKIASGRITTRPIAGTHPRLPDPVDDALQKQRLVAHPKERAEHIMLVDLERNDLGRVCAPGSVRVDALMEVASYTHVHHIESTVSGQLRPEVTLFDVVRALFPGGTITGCPKVRTMQIIAGLEGSPRRAYTGSLGYINHDGSADFNILIRSFWVDGDTVEVRAGAGIVADSDPERELAETRAKARGLLSVLVP